MPSNSLNHNSTNPTSRLVRRQLVSIQVCFFVKAPQIGGRFGVPFKPTKQRIPPKKSLPPPRFDLLTFPILQFGGCQVTFHSPSCCSVARGFCFRGSPIGIAELAIGATGNDRSGVLGMKSGKRFPERKPS